VGANANLEANPEWLQKDPYGKGWLYEVKGDPEPNAMDAQNYAKLLDDTIDKMVGA
jgi:glycine cleavage system H lipoate-binding protein